MGEEWELPEAPQLLYAQACVSLRNTDTLGRRHFRYNMRAIRYDAHYLGVPEFHCLRYITRAQYRDKRFVESVWEKMRRDCETGAMAYVFCGPFPAPPIVDTPQAQQEYRAALDLYNRKSEWFKR